MGEIERLSALVRELQGAVAAPEPSVSFSAGSAVATSPAANTWTKVSNTSEDWDLDGSYDAPNSRFTPKVAGVYRLTVAVAFSTNVPDQATVRAGVLKNGVLHRTVNGTGKSGANNNDTWAGSVLVEANGTTDYFEAGCFISAAGMTTALASSCYFQGELAEAT